MISYDDAIDLLLAEVQPLRSEIVTIDQLNGRTLAQDIVAMLDAPRADVSAMDGYAVCKASAETRRWLQVTGESAAGSPFTGSIAPGQAVRIFTGAHVPDGADAVVIQEHAERDGDRVRFRSGFGPCRHIRRRGSDFAVGDVLLQSGHRVDARAMIAVAGADVASVAVARRPNIAIICTGDELLPPGAARLDEHRLPESCSYGVAALAQAGGAVLTEPLRGRDDLEELSIAANRALHTADCVVVIGGASVGDHDFARPMFKDTGVKEIFAKVAIKPGKPVWFGMAGRKPVLGLPGNPTSAMVTARLFLVPMLAALQGASGRGEVRFRPQILASPLPPGDSRETFVRAMATADGLIPASNQESGSQAPLAASDWLIRRRVREKPLAAGETIDAVCF